MTVIWRETPDGWQVMAPAGFQDEAALHELVAREPQLLPLSGSPQLAVLGREVSVGAGRADVIAVESTGRPVIIEVKLAKNAEARRAVVTQALTYASYLVGLTVAEFEGEILERHLQGAGFKSIADAVAAQDQEGAFEIGDFNAGLAEALESGSFRVVLALDDAPAELVRLVGYLEKVTDGLTVDLVTVTAYDHAGTRFVVPQRLDPDRAQIGADHGAPRQRSSGELSRGPAVFLESIDATTPDRETLLRMVDWAQELESQGLCHLYSYRGKTGRTTLLPRVPSEDAGLVTIWNEGGAFLAFWRSVFERCAPDNIEAVEAVLGKSIGQGNWTNEITDKLLSAVTDAYRAASDAPAAAT